MPGCCAVGCTNRDSKGFLMKRFPSDPERRKLWASKVKRANWTPTNYSYLCEAHFTPDMFEQHRADGKRKLKPNAVPTIFSYIPLKKKRKPPSERKSPRKEKIALEEVEPSAPETIHIDESTPITTIEETIEDPLSVPLSSSPASSLSIYNRMERDFEEKIKAYNKAYAKVVRMNKILKNRLRQAKRGAKAAEQNSYLKCLKKVFNNNQIRALMKNKVGGKTKWDTNTIKKGIKLKFSCGSAGYDELLKQNYPLPSQRTLNRYVKDIKVIALF